MDDIQIGKDNDTICLKHKTGLNLTLYFRQCSCDCHNNNLNSLNNIPKNLKLNSFKTNSFNKNYNNPIQKEYNNNNNDTAKQQEISSKQLIDKKNINIYNRNNYNISYGKKTYDSLCRDKLKLNIEKNDIKNSLEQNNKESQNKNYSNNEFLIYKKDINGVNNFIKSLHEINDKELTKCSSLKDFRYFDNKYLYYDNNKISNNQKYNKKDNSKININIVYDTNNFLKNSKMLENNYQKNEKYNKILNCKKSKNNNILSKNVKIQRKNFITKNSKEFVFNKDYISNNNIYNYYIYDNNDYDDNYKTNYNYSKDLESNDFNIIDNNLNPLGHIVDNFVKMLKNKNSKKNIMDNGNCIYKQNYNNMNNKYYNNIMKKKEKLDKICISNKNYKDNDINSNYINLGNEIKTNVSNNKKNIMIKNGIKERKNEYEKKYGKNKNTFINKTKNIFQNQIKENNNKNNNYIKNNCLSKSLTFNKYKEEYISIPNQYINNNNSLENENNYQNTKNEVNNNFVEQINSSKNSNNDNINQNSEYLNMQLNLDKNNYLEKYNTNYNISQKNNIFQIEKFDISIQKEENKSNLIKNDNNSNNQNYKFSSTPSKINYTNDIQNPSNLSPNYTNSKTNELMNNYMVSKENNSEQIKILSSPSIIKYDIKNKSETVAEKVRKLINQKAKNNNLSLSTKLNLDTNLSLSDENEEDHNDCINNINRNISISPESIFTIYYKYEKPIILAFDIENKSFSFQDYSDFGNFEENYKLSLKANESENINNDGNLFITIDTNLYIITGKNHDMLYMFDSIKKTINKLCDLKNNHSNGTLLKYENNIICLSGIYNKKVEIYSIKKNEWNDLPEMLKERSDSSSCIINNKTSKYIFNLFGYNSPSKEYLNSIEYFDISKKDSNWRYLNYNNLKWISLNISNFYCINYDDNKIIVVGGYNGKENKYNQKFIQIILDKDENNLGNNIYVEETDRKLKDIDMNKKYNFNKGYKMYYNKNNEIFYEIFDDNFNCHLFQASNIAHDLFYFNY